MKKAIALLAISVLVAGALIFGALELTKNNGHPKSTSTALPGVAVNLIACGSGQSGVECIAIYKGQCAVFAFNAAGQATTAQPIDPKYCGQ